MPPDAPPDMAAIERELELIALAISDTRVALQAGGVIDLAGLDDRVAGDLRRAGNPAA